MRILIIGKNSYIGKNLKKWLEKYPEQYEVDSISVRNREWVKKDFSVYDVLINLAGVAHINNITQDMKEHFYEINRDLAVELGTKAKEERVKHFIQFSSMNVYGDYCDNVRDRENVNPTSFYGDSKLQGDIALQRLADAEFCVALIRPPFVYGKECSGNYRLISKIANRIPVFVDYPNQKSMIYIDNLCEFIRLIIDDRLGGCFTPQNRELISTTELVRMIARQNNHTLYFTRFFNPVIKVGLKMTKIVRKGFADDYYSLQLSDYYDFDYCVVNLEESIKRTEC